MRTKRRPEARADEEELAAFLDGALDPESREAVAGRIARDPEARLLLVEAARFRDDEHLAGRAWPRTGPAARPPESSARGVFSSRGARWAGALAASLLLGLSAWSDRASSFDSDWSSILAKGSPAQVLARHVRPHDANVFGFAAGDAVGAQSFRLGVATVDLQVGLAVGADPAALDEITRVVRGAVGPAPSSARDALDRVFADDLPDRPHFELGRWVEASRIAAATGQAAFFESPEFQRALRLARRGAWTEEARAELEHVDDAIRNGRPDTRRLERAFEQVVRLY